MPDGIQVLPPQKSRAAQGTDEEFSLGHRRRECLENAIFIGFRWNRDTKILLQSWYIWSIFRYLNSPGKRDSRCFVLYLTRIAAPFPIPMTSRQSRRAHLGVMNVRLSTTYSKVHPMPDQYAMPADVDTANRATPAPAEADVALTKIIQAIAEINPNDWSPVNVVDVDSALLEQSLKLKSPIRLKEVYSQLATALFKASGLSEDLERDFSNAVHDMLHDFRRRELQRTLPARPLRDMRRGESIVDYIRSPEGFGPWLDAGVLSRPLIREIGWSPKAYDALANYLRNKELPDDIRIPKKTEMVAEELARTLAGGNVEEQRRWSARTASRLNRHVARN